MEVQEEYIKDEQKNLKKEYLHAQEEVKRIQSVPLVIGQFLEAVDQNNGIVGSTTGKTTLITYNLLLACTLYYNKNVLIFFSLFFFSPFYCRFQLLCAYPVHY